MLTQNKPDTSIMKNMFFTLADMTDLEEEMEKENMIIDQPKEKIKCDPIFKKTLGKRKIEVLDNEDIIEFPVLQLTKHPRKIIKKERTQEKS